MYSSLIVSFTVDVFDAPGGVVDTNHLLLKVGVGLTTTGRGGVDCRGTGDMAVARCLTLNSDLLSRGRGSLGGRGS